MDYPVTTSAQLRAVLRGLRQSQQLSQTQAGQRLGVNQKRLARIEAAPGVTSFDQIARLVSALGGRLVVSVAAGTAEPPAPAAPQPGRKSGAQTKPAGKFADGW
jgi:HTH-type transcriptional regulator/antitoxin HipB